MPEYWPANKLIGILEHVLIEAKDIIGELTSDQIESLAAKKITGQLTDEQLKEIAAAKIAGQLTSSQIKELEAAKIAGQLVDAQLKEITAGKIKGLLTAAQIESLEAAKITGQLTSEQIKELEAAKIAGQISKSQIAAEAISTEKLVALAVTAGKIAVEAITAEKIAAGTITANKLAVGSVTAEKIAAEAVESAKIKALAITTEKLGAESVTAGKIAANAITAEKILAESITAVKIAVGAITAEKLAAGSVTAGKIAVESLSAISANLGTVTAGKLTAVEIEAVKKLALKQGSEGELGKEAGSEIQWLSGETVRHSISSRFNAVSKGLRLELASIGSKNTSALVIEASDSTELKGGIRAEPKVGISATIFTPEERSDFLQLAVTGKRRYVAGVVTETGGIGVGEGFTVSHPATGKYKIKFSKEFFLKPTVIITVAGAGTFTWFRWHWIVGSEKTEVEIESLSSTSVLTNQEFSFSAFG